MKRSRRNKETKGVGNTVYRDFQLLYPLCSEECKKEIGDYIMALECPVYIEGKKIPENLNHLTYGQLDDLSRSNRDNPVVSVFETVLGFKEETTLQLKVREVFGFSNFVTREVSHINEMFSSIGLEHTSDEIAAGIERLNFGSFGVLDWYAKRMGITNQNEVRNVPWVRIYTCMKNDTAQAAYERRYNQVITSKSKTSRR